MPANNKLIFVILLMLMYAITSVAGIGDAIEAFRRLTHRSPESPVTPVAEQTVDRELLQMDSYCRKLDEPECISTSRCEAIYGDDDFNLNAGVYALKIL